MEARIKTLFWIDAMGRAVKIELEGSTGDPALDAEIKRVLMSVIYRSPPSDIRMPVITRVSGTRAG
jgi:outer membrane biosynthesis protein TonB